MKKERADDFASSVSHVQSFLLQARDWAYLGEGASNVVVAYTGNHEPLTGTVLRLRKRLGPKPGSPPFPSAADLLVWGDALGVGSDAPREEWQWQYTRRVIVRLPLAHAQRRALISLLSEPLIGRRFVDSGELVPVTPAFIESVAERAAPLRPPHRAAHSIDASARFALLLPNFASPERVLSGRGASASGSAGESSSRLPHLSVEIKPKCGFLPTSDAVCKIGGELKRSRSRFHLHQHLKVESGKYSLRSSYCPLELFSGHGGRLRGALRQLLENPQNNLAVRAGDGWRFPPRDNTVQRGDGGDAGADCAALALQDRLQSFFVPPVETSPSTAGGAEAPSAPVDAFIELVACALEASCVLDSVLAAQRLDGHDVDGAIEAYCGLFGEEPEVVEALRASESKDAATTEARAALRGLAKEEAVWVVRDFLVALSAKDCSILLCFVPAPPRENDSDELGQGRDAQQDRVDRDATGLVSVSVLRREFLCSVAVVDTDIRPVSRIPKYYLEEKRIIAAAAAAAGQD